MTLIWRRMLLGLGVASLIAIVFAIVEVAGLGTILALAVAALVGGAAAALASRPVEAAIVPPAPPVPARPMPAPSVAVAPVEPDMLARLRHDLRGILSPALLTADRLLATTDDALVRRAAETMIETVERANARLTATRSDAPPAGP